MSTGNTVRVLMFLIEYLIVVNILVKWKIFYCSVISSADHASSGINDFLTHSCWIYLTMGVSFHEGQ